MFYCLHFVWINIKRNFTTLVVWQNAKKKALNKGTCAFDDVGTLSCRIYVLKENESSVEGITIEADGDRRVRKIIQNRRGRTADDG